MNAVEARQLLGVEAGASPAQLRSAYHAMLKKWHPDRLVVDRASYPEAVRHTQRLNAAYQLLAADSRGHTPGGDGHQPTAAETWSGQTIATIDWKLWPMRRIASDQTTVPEGLLLFAVAWAIIVGLALAAEALLS